MSTTLRLVFCGSVALSALAGAMVANPESRPRQTVRPTNTHSSASVDAPISAGWQVECHDDEFSARSPEFPAFIVPLFCDGGTVRLLGWKISTENPQLGLLRYASGVAGTSSLYAMTRVALIRLSGGQVLGHPLERIEALHGAAEQPQPVWTWHDGVLTVKTDEEATTYQP